MTSPAFISNATADEGNYPTCLHHQLLPTCPTLVCLRKVHHLTLVICHCFAQLSIWSVSCFNFFANCNVCVICKPICASYSYMQVVNITTNGPSIDFCGTTLVTDFHRDRHIKMQWMERCKLHHAEGMCLIGYHVQHKCCGPNRLVMLYVQEPSTTTRYQANLDPICQPALNQWVPIFWITLSCRSLFMALINTHSNHFKKFSQIVRWDFQWAKLCQRFQINPSLSNYGQVLHLAFLGPIISGVWCKADWPSILQN